MDDGETTPRGVGPMACVLGEIDLLRALHLAGIEAAVVAQPGNPVRYSRMARAVIEWRDPWSEPEALVEALLTFGRAQPEPPVLFYDGDWDLLLISRERERLGEAFRFVVPDAALVEALVDKERFRAFAEQHELPVPRSVQLRSDDALPGDIGLDYPLVVKPLVRQHATWKRVSDAKAVFVDSPQELRDLRERLAAAGVEALVQEAIPGPECHILSYHVYVDGDGDIAGEFTGRKLRTYPASCGSTTALTTTRCASIRALGRDIVARIGLRGVAKLDFKLAPDGGHRLLEINPRFNLWHHPGALAGVNLPALVYDDLAGFPRAPAAEAREGVTWCSLRHDLPAARASGMPIAAWLRAVATSDGTSACAWDDPLPLPRAAAARVCRHLVRRLPGRASAEDVELCATA